MTAVLETSVNEQFDASRASIISSEKTVSNLKNDFGGFNFNNKIVLRFDKNRTFKIVQFTDTQDDQNIDSRTVVLIEKVMKDQSPDLVVFTGDNITRGPKTRADVEQAIANFIRPVDNCHVPWLITFGNHDEDHTSLTGVNEDEMLDIYMSYKYNINKKLPGNGEGTGDMLQLVYGSRQMMPVFNIWALDSGKYAPSEIAGQSLSGLKSWDWIKQSQISWYVNSSRALEMIFGKKIPSLMFFHIPLYEFSLMHNSSDRHGVIGEKNEEECPGAFNSGLFTALLDRKDVNGVFVGHDHVNDYVGNYYGIYLGYSASTGFSAYGLDGAEKNRLRGARVFTISEDNPEKFQTYMVYARDYGIQ